MLRRLWLISSLVFLFSLCLGSSQSVWAQSNFSSIRGEVTDATGAAIPGAKVKLVDAGTSAEIIALTDASGRYAATGLRPVVYNISVEAQGFERALRNNVKLDTAQDLGLDFALEAGNITDAVTVTTEAPLIQTESSVVSQTISQRVINDLPLNGRNKTGREVCAQAPRIGDPGLDI